MWLLRFSDKEKGPDDGGDSENLSDPEDLPFPIGIDAVKEELSPMEGSIGRSGVLVGSEEEGSRAVFFGDAKGKVEAAVGVDVAEFAVNQGGLESGRGGGKKSAGRGAGSGREGDLARTFIGECGGDDGGVDGLGEGAEISRGKAEAVGSREEVNGVL